jgi:hypothetical protein
MLELFKDYFSVLEELILHKYEDDTELLTALCDVQRALWEYEKSLNN